MNMSKSSWMISLVLQEMDCEFKVMPFGLCNVPATFEWLIEQVLVGLPVSVALVYLDDILVPRCTFSQECANLGQEFEQLRKAKLKLSPKKCVLFQTGELLGSFCQ